MSFSEQVGQETLDSVTGITQSLLELLISLAREKAKHKDYEKNKSGIYKLIEYMKKGGEIKSVVLDSKDAKVMEACMKAFNITYAATKTVDDNGKSIVVFWYRASDEPVVLKAKNKFIYEMGYGNGCVDPREFMEYNMNRTIKTKKGLNEVELEVFMHYANNENIKFSYVKSETEKNKWDIIYMQKNEEQINRALCSMAYDLSGPEGEKYYNEVEEHARNRILFNEKIKNIGDEPKVIVDSKNPHNFITVTADNFTTHCIDVVKQKELGGETREILADKNTISISSYDREELMNYVEELESPIIMNLSDFKLIKGLSKTNEAIIIPEDQFREEYKKLSSVLENRTDKYEGKVVHEPTKISDTIYTYVNIPQSVHNFLYEEIENYNLDQTILMSGNLACSDRDYPAVRNIIERALYGGKNSRERLEAKLFYEHNEILNLNKQPIDTQYIVDAKNPDYVVKIANEGMTIYKDSVEEVTIDSKDNDYEKIVIKTIDSIKKPIVLSEEEEKSPEKIKIIQDRVVHKGENKAVDYLRNYEKNEKEALYTLKGEVNLEKLNNRQREAISRLNTYETEEIYVDRTVREKINDYTIDKKIKNENSIKNDEINMN